MIVAFSHRTAPFQPTGSCPVALTFGTRAVNYRAAAIRAIKHISKFGDTDLFPSLPEMLCYSQNLESVSKVFELLTVGNYRPSNCIETLTPKSSLGFRISHQLTAQDNIVYLASTILCGPQLESLRKPDKGGEAFAYRFSGDEGERIFAKGRSYHDWINHLILFGAQQNPFDEGKHCVTTDISDFYQRIYFHRLENILADSNADQKAASYIKKLIQKVRAKQSFGIPVGSSASRLLAETILSYTDNFLSSLGFKSTRYVDDFRIIVASELEEHSALCKLAEHLMVTEGLSLNVSKTRIQTAADMHKSAKKRLADAFTSGQMLEIEAYIRLNYGEDEDDSDVEEDTSNTTFMNAANFQDKLSEISDKDYIDLSIYKAILRALRFLPGVDILRLIDEQSQLLYYIPREFCLVIRSALKNDQTSGVDVANKILTLIKSQPFSDMAFVRAWVLDLFARGPLVSSAEDFNGYDFSRSIFEKRYELILRGRWDDKPFFRAKRAKFSEFSDWEKPAALLGAMCLPDDEYGTWVDHVADDVPGPFAKIFTSWLKNYDGDLLTLLGESV